jgi:hypothetical protein
VGETIAFSVCNKPFKPLGLPSGRVKSREGLARMIPINILKHYVVEKQESTQKRPGYSMRTQTDDFILFFLFFFYFLFFILT